MTTENAKKKEHRICIFETSEFHSEYDDITRHLPIGDFITVDNDRYKELCEYVSWANRQRSGIYLTLVHISSMKAFNWEQFNIDMEEAKKQRVIEEEKKAAALEKRKAAAAARKLKKQMQDAENEKALLAELVKKHGMPKD